MGRFNALLFLVFAVGLMSSVSMAKDPLGGKAPVAAAPKLSPIDTPSSASVAKAPSLAQAPAAAAPKLSPIETPAAAPPASAPCKVAITPSSASSPTAQAPASSLSAEGPGPALPPSSGATATTSLEKIIAIIGAALIGGAAFLL